MRVSVVADVASFYAIARASMGHPRKRKKSERHVSSLNAVNSCRIWVSDYPREPDDNKSHDRPRRRIVSSSSAGGKLGACSDKPVRCLDVLISLVFAVCVYLFVSALRLLFLLCGLCNAFSIYPTV